jgi:cytochrome c biogenesis protein CcmG, thiol:disulfide interchange protein DsbE
MKRLGFYVPVLLFASLIAYFGVGLTMNPERLPSTLIGRPLPEFSLGPIPGLEQGLASRDLVGQVALVNVFGSWCIACIYEHPQLMRIAREGTVPVYGLDWKDPPGAGMQWLRERGNPYAAVGNDADGRVAIDLGVTGAPETFVIDAKGIIRYKHIGPITPEAWEKTILPIIRDLQQ